MRAAHKMVLCSFLQSHGAWRLCSGSDLAESTFTHGAILHPFPQPLHSGYLFKFCLFWGRVFMSQAEFELATHWRITLNFRSLRPYSAAITAVWHWTWNCELLGFVHVRQVLYLLSHTPSLVSSVLMAIWLCCGQDFMWFSECFFSWPFIYLLRGHSMCLLHFGWMCLKNTDEHLWVNLQMRQSLLKDLKNNCYKNMKIGLENGLAVKSTGCSCRRPRLSSQHMWEFSSPSGTPVPEHPVPSLGFFGHNTYVVHIHTCRQGIQIKIYAQNKKINLL